MGNSQENASKYQICADHILEYIREHALEAGNKLPTEQQFTQMFGVSRITIRRAITELEGKGIVTKAQGSGTFVAQPPSATIFQADIPLVIPGSSSGTVYSLLQGASEYLEDHAYHLRSCFAQGTVEDERATVEKLVAEGYRLLCNEYPEAK